MNENQWFALYRDMPGLLVTAAEVEEAIAALPDEIDQRLPDNLAACEAAQAAGIVVGWWQRELAHDPVPDTWTDAAGRIWIKDADGHLAPPADLDTGSGIESPDELYAWCWGYQYAAAAPV